MATAGPVLPSVLTQGEGLGDNVSIHGSTEKLNSSAVNRILMEFLVYVGRAFLVFYPVYLTGYLGLSISWVLLCMLMITWWKKNRQWKDTRIGTAIEFVDNETTVINKELRSALQMASWVCVCQSVTSRATAGCHWAAELGKQVNCTWATSSQQRKSAQQQLRSNPGCQICLCLFVVSDMFVGQSQQRMYSVQVVWNKVKRALHRRTSGHVHCWLDNNTLYLHDMPDLGWTSHTQKWVKPAKRAVILQDVSPLYIWLHHTHSVTHINQGAKDNKGSSGFRGV